MRRGERHCVGLITVKDIEKARSPALRARDFPEEELTALVDNTWRDTGKAIVNNWLGLVYQHTNLDRRKQYMEDVDPDDPLGLGKAS